MGVKTAHLQDFMAMFDVVVCGNDPEVKRGKPSPDIFLVAREKLGNPPLEQCLVFEDSPLGVQAGRSAGMQVLSTSQWCSSVKHTPCLRLSGCPTPTSVTPTQPLPTLPTVSSRAWSTFSLPCLGWFHIPHREVHPTALHARTE